MKTRQYPIQKEHSTITSLEIAEMAGKQHKHVMRSIRDMEETWEKITESKFGLSDYQDSTGRTLPVYVLNKTECLYISSKFSDEIRARLVLRWVELEGLVEQDLSKHYQETRSTSSRDNFASIIQANYYRYTTTEIAEILRVGVVELNDYLVQIGVQKKTHRGWALYSFLHDRKWADTYLEYEKNEKGNIVLKTHLLWTKAGKDHILKCLKEDAEEREKQNEKQYIQRNMESYRQQITGIQA